MKRDRWQGLLAHCVLQPLLGGLSLAIVAACAFERWRERHRCTEDVDPPPEEPHRMAC